MAQDRVEPAQRNGVTRDGLAAIAREIAACRACRDAPLGGSLPHEPRPIFRLSRTAKLLIASQAPGVRAHDSGVPFDDPSGERLRAWMGVDRDTFYDAGRVAIAPMGFCFPGHDAGGGDLPPRRECRILWHDRLFRLLPQVETVLAVGGHAHAYHFGRLRRPRARGAKVDETVRRWRLFESDRPKLFPLPHPSWRNSAWLKRNPWFEAELLPDLRAEVARLVLGRGEGSA